MVKGKSHGVLKQTIKVSIGMFQWVFRNNIQRFLQVLVSGMENNLNSTTILASSCSLQDEIVEESYGVKITLLHNICEAIN